MGPQTRAMPASSVPLNKPDRHGAAALPRPPRPPPVRVALAAGASSSSSASPGSGDLRLPAAAVWAAARRRSRHACQCAPAVAPAAPWPPAGWSWPAPSCWAWAMPATCSARLAASLPARRKGGRVGDGTCKPRRPRRRSGGGARVYPAPARPPDMVSSCTGWWVTRCWAASPVMMITLLLPLTACFVRGGCNLLSAGGHAAAGACLRTVPVKPPGIATTCAPSNYTARARGTHPTGRARHRR